MGVLTLLGLYATISLAWPLHGSAADRIAPKITGTHWLNTKPLTPADLKERVVLVEFWTYG